MNHRRITNLKYVFGAVLVDASFAYLMMHAWNWTAQMDRSLSMMTFTYWQVAIVYVPICQIIRYVIFGEPATIFTSKETR